MQPGDAKPKTLSTFHPQFTYPIFGDDEQIFGYKGLIIRLRFAAHDLRPHVHISYDDRFKAVGDTAAMDLLGALKGFVPEGKPFSSVVSADCELMVGLYRGIRELSRLPKGSPGRPKRKRLYTTGQAGL